MLLPSRPATRQHRHLNFKNYSLENVRQLSYYIRNIEARWDIDIKNLLLTGVVTAKQVADAIGRSSGKEYECSPHHFDENTEVHIIKTQQGDKSWYIKWYFISPNVVFISVHE